MSQWDDPSQHDIPRPTEQRELNRIACCDWDIVHNHTIGDKSTKARTCEHHPICQYCVKGIDHPWERKMVMPDHNLSEELTEEVDHNDYSGITNYPTPGDNENREDAAIDKIFSSLQKALIYRAINTERNLLDRLYLCERNYKGLKPENPVSEDQQEEFRNQVRELDEVENILYPDPELQS